MDKEISEEAAALLGIKTGLADVAAGRVQPADEVFRDLRAEFGIEDDSEE